MFGKMMNRYYYGKSGQGDYNKDNLPQTRIQLFWEMLRIRFAALMRLNLMYMVIWIPAMIVIARGVMLWYSGMVGLSELQAEVDAGTLALESFRESYATWGDAQRSILMQTLLLLVPCIAITGPCTSGLCYVTRNWARDEHAFAWSDFKDAVKENWKPSILMSLITGFMPLLIYVCFVFYGDMAKQNPLFMLPQVLSVMLGAIWMMMQIYTYPQIVTYTLPFRGVLKNSLLMAVGRLPMSIGLRLLSVVPALICAAVGLLTPYFQYALLAYGLYYVLLGFALSRFVGASYTNAVFDRYINVKIDGAQVGRGLYKEEDDDEDDEADEAPALTKPDAGKNTDA